MIDDDLIGLDGTDLIDDDGNDLLVDAEGNLCKCGCGDEPHYGCGSDNTCNQFCVPTIKDFSRGHDCDCPCSNRRGYPPGYSVQWDGVTISAGPYPTNHFSPGGYMVVTGGLVANFTECSGPTTIHQQFYDVDGNPEATEDNTLNGSIEVEVSNCGKSIHVTGTCVWGVNIPGGNAIVATIDLTLSRCDGGSGAAILGANPSAVDAGFVTVAPKCRDCLDNPLQGIGDPAAICGGHITFLLAVWDAVLMMNVIHTFELFGGPSAWSGADGEGNTATISNRGTPDDPAFPCCGPTDGNNDCICGGDPPNHCEECWTLLVNIGGCVYEWHSQGPCPNMGGNPLSGSGIGCIDVTSGNIQITFFGFADTCP